MRLRYLGLLLLALGGCTTTGSVSKPQAEARAGSGVVFIEDDAEGALRRAREQRLPLFVEAWAPWCHACRALRSTVLTDPALRPHADRFVWLAINTDSPTSAGFLERFPVDTWPTLFVIDAEREALLARSLGGVTVPQLVAFLQEGARASREGPRDAAADLARADAHAVMGEHAVAVAAYQRALSSLPPDAPLRAGTVVSLLKSLRAQDNALECMQEAARELPHLSRTDDRARVLYVGTACALDAEAEDGKDLRASLTEQTARAIASPPEALHPDLRSSLYESLVELRQLSGDEAAVRSLTTEWLTFIEQSAESARGPEARAAFDGHRMMAAMILEQPERAIPALLRSERELPDDYNPPARLATLYLQAGQLDRALQSSERALSLVRGAARAMVLSGHAQVLVVRGERARAEQLLTEALQSLDGARADINTQRQRRVLQGTLKRVKASGG